MHFRVRWCRNIMCLHTTEPHRLHFAFFLRCFLNHAFLSNPRFNLLNSSAIFIITFGFNLFFF